MTVSTVLEKLRQSSRSFAQSSPFRAFRALTILTTVRACQVGSASTLALLDEVDRALRVQKEHQKAGTAKGRQALQAPQKLPTVTPSHTHARARAHGT